MDDTRIRSLEDLRAVAAAYEAKDAAEYHVRVCGGGACVSGGCAATRDAAEAFIRDNGLEGRARLTFVGCMGLCSQGPLLYIEPEGALYVKVTPDMARDIIGRHVIAGEVAEEYTWFDETKRQHVPLLRDIPFFSGQMKIALRNCGKVEFDSLESYICAGGFFALHKALGMKREEVVSEVTLSGLRGRGGGGFPTGRKWEAGMKAPGDVKYLICNADEGDPGAFMDRALIESDPFGLIEGMMIGAYAIGAAKGFVYIRAEYPVAVQRLTRAIEILHEAGLLGEDILGSGFRFDLEIRIGAGAFVCGEETALMRSVEGERGEPTQKPPFPFEKGLFGCPTIINNVETFAVVPAVLQNGGAWHAGIGTEKSKGTKVFALAGDIRSSGLAEVPMGYKIGDLIYKIGGGIPRGGRFKAAQIGGPSGGCVTKQYLNTPLDYESLTSLGAIMGSGGLVVMSEDTCMVDTARFFMDFIRDESCGKCVPCRIGSKRMLEILERITRGEGREEDVPLLRELAENIGQTAMCGLGQTAPNPVLSTLRFFAQEYEDHIKTHHCEAGVCSTMFISPCQNACPAGINVPGYMALIGNGRFLDAYNLIRQENPFPGVCGRVCTHPCEDKCRRSQRDEALAICSLKRFVSDYAMNHEGSYVDDIKYPKNGKKVAIVGAGPSGLTCGYYLARLGYSVEVFESQPQAGGTLAYGIPEYRLPEDILQHEIRQIEQEGVVIHLGQEVGKSISFAYLRENFQAVYLTTGTQFPNEIGIGGESLKGVCHGLSFLKDIHSGRRVKTGRQVVVIGGGSTAMDAARSCLRLGAAQVTVIYRREKEDMPSNRAEIREALEEGVQLMTMVAPVEILGDDKGKVRGIVCQKMRSADYDSKGRPRSTPVEGSNFVLDCDMVIPAVSQHADFPFISSRDVEVTAWGTLVTSRDSLMTSIQGVFAGGDLVRGPETVIAAIADGKKAAQSIDIYLGGSGKLNKGRPIDIPEAIPEEESTEYGRFPAEELDVATRIQGFREVNKGYRKLFAVAEAARCLRCDRR